MTKNTLNNTVKVVVRRWLRAEVWVDLDGLKELTEDAVRRDAADAADYLEPLQWAITDEEQELSRIAKDLVARVMSERNHD